MSLIQIKHAVRRLSLSQLRKLDVWLHELIRKAEEADRAEQSTTRKRTVAEQTLDNRTYRLESIRCGKENCKCGLGKLHGPYWYSYMRIEGTVKSKYVGKKLPRAVEKSLRLRNDR
jgi:hypothetical protein